MFDPGRELLAYRQIDKPEPMWTAELAGATLALDRAAAAGALALRGAPAALAALAGALDKDPFWAVSGSAALGLAVIRTHLSSRRALLRAAMATH